MPRTHAPRPFAVLLQGYRAAAALSQEELAQLAGLSRRGISDLERGARREPYPTTVRRLADALRLTVAEREVLLASTRRGDAGSSGQQAEPARATLPTVLSSFIGRDREMAEVPRLLEATRLLTLTGTGGAGKTRLAVQVAAEMLGSYPDGLWFVDLAPLADGELLVAAVSAVLGVLEEPTRRLAATLADVLNTRRVLLVLDNCEHLVRACAVFAHDLLSACPNLRILATSREALRIDGETVWRVPSLSVPGQPLGSLEELRHVDAVRLFEERAVAAHPNFRLTDQNAAPVSEICRRLDGIPLAIELAAAGLSVLPVEQLAARLDDRLSVLTGGRRLAPPRHQTLRAAIVWSYDLLSEPERRCFNGLSVFADGWSLEAAEALCTEEHYQHGATLKLLRQLVDKCLVHVEDHNGEARFRMLETLREFGREQLHSRGETAAMRDRHTDFFLRLAETAEPEFWGPRIMPWLARLELEHDNLRAALNWCLTQRDAPRGLRLGGALARFWLSHGHLSEGRDWLRRLLLLPEDSAHALGRATAVNGAALLADYQGDSVAARELAEEAVTRARTLGARRLLAMALAPLASSLFHYGDLPAAKAAYEQGFAVSRAEGDQALEALHAVLLGRILHAQGDVVAAREFCDAGLALARKTGYARMQMRALLYLGLLSHQAGDLGPARVYLQASLGLSRPSGDKVEIQRVLVELARLATDERDSASARRYLTEAIELGREIGHRELIAKCVCAMSRLLAVDGQPKQALHLIGAANWWYQTRTVRPPADAQADLTAGLAAAQSTLSETAAEEALAAGRALTIDQAIDVGQRISLEPAIDDACAPQPEGVPDVTTPAPQTDGLTAREREVAALIARGLTNRMIAAELVVSKRTADGHVANILRKLALETRTQIAVWVVAHELGPERS